jgi:Uma2 family endonuclease
MTCRRDIELSGYGSWTVQDEKAMCGAEADDCYIFGTERRDRPHLSIEVEWTEANLDKLQIYEKLGVDEVWIWRNGVIEVYALTGTEYVREQRSRILPALDLALLVSMFDRDTLTQAMRDFRALSLT